MHGLKTMTLLIFFAFILNILIVNSEANVRLTVLHTNDVHARFEQVNQYGGRCPLSDVTAGRCYGGAARLQTKVEEIRSTKPNVILLNAGDYYQGTLYFNLHTHNVTSTFMNKVKYDVMALGNHEFDNGVQGLVPFLDAVQFPVVACNLNLTSEPRLQGKIYCSCEKRLKTGEVVGIIGYLTPETATLNDAGTVIFEEEIRALNLAANELKDAGVKIIIALGHSGFTMDKLIAQQVPWVDIVVGGHTNTFLYNGNASVSAPVSGQYPLVITRSDQSKALVVQDYAYGIYLGYLEADFDSAGDLVHWEGNPILLDNSVPQDNSTLRLLEPYKEQVDSYGDEVIGSTDVYLQEDYTCRFIECSIGNFLTDAVVSFYRLVKTGYKQDPVRIAIWNSGIIRGSIDEQANQGKITIADVMLVAPYGNTIDLVRLKGRDLKRVLEHSVATYDVTGEHPSGAFLQVAGLRVTYNVSNAAGSRVSSLEAVCALCRVPRFLPVEDYSDYLMAVPSYTVEGGDGFSVISETAIEILHAGDLDLDIIVSYIKRTSPVYAALEGRINIVK